MTEHTPLYHDMADKPLFGESRPRDRMVNLIVGALTVILVVFTLISAFAFPSWPPLGLNVYFAICIVLICASNVLLINWYRQGDLDPKFRLMIYYNTLCVLLICICANCYFHKGK
ncbi:PREDICTED: transmembrane protein 243-like [Priapulus caudatus]|uniref:Transmembrane protein 243-like n=1 Tax=Priapulus caudatus TaxID=37621 RepID=A0ABM1EPL9_PRICU|nr:PREDICTED: transmembrane protein 243-like [Priapulus caudatus]XP_014674141.1 PREDICTED: transmembrane protein 243-like [Priapulus caudatus]